MFGAEFLDAIFFNEAIKMDMHFSPIRLKLTHQCRLFSKTLFESISRILIHVMESELVKVTRAELVDVLRFHIQ